MVPFLLAFLVVEPCSAETGTESVSTPSGIVGVTVTPHVISEVMKYRRPRDPGLAARVQLFIRGGALPSRISGKTPREWLQSGDWAWHDMDTAVKGLPESLAVWTFNGKTDRWGVGQSFEVDLPREGNKIEAQKVQIEKPTTWISSITFLGNEDKPQPNEMVLHVVNASNLPVDVTGVRLWLPRDNASWQTLFSADSRGVSYRIPQKDRGLIRLAYPQPLPLTYAAVEVTTRSGTLWAHLRIKKEAFDISGGWIGDHLREELYLKLLSRLHVNCGQIQTVPGFTDNPQRYQRYPIKLFNRLMPLEEFDTDRWLPHIHAVEFLGEPQYGGGRPVPPQEVFDQLLPYRKSRLPTSVTHSEERVWRFYAGLSDYPHYDAYRVVAPAADAWSQYDRWDGKKISWGAPLETIGELCRSLRDLNRPVPVAYWSQGPHDGWGSAFRLGGRARRSPTPAELRSQAVHALSTRITSLYWFNLSLKSLLKFPDTWDEMTRIGREIKMLAPLYLEGDAHRWDRVETTSGKPDWDCASIVASDCALLFANDLAYAPDPKENLFVFGPPRPFQHRYALPHWLRGIKDLFRVDAEGIHEVKWSIEGDGVRVEGTFARDAIFVASLRPNLRQEIEDRRQKALQWEAKNPVDRDALNALLQNRSR